MKVLHVIDSGGLYGAELMLLNLAQEQLQLGCTVTIASISEPNIPPKEIDNEARKRGIPLKRFIMKPGISYSGAKSILCYGIKEGFQLIHSHGYKGNILLGVLPIITRELPVVTTIHGYTSTRLLSKMYVYEWLDRRMWCRLDGVVLVNRQMLSHSGIKRVKHRKLAVIENGIPFDAETWDIPDNESTRQIKTFCKQGIIVGSVGRYSPEKGFDLLIRAVKILKDNGLDIKLLLIGEGTERRHLEQLIAECELHNSVLLTGYYQEAYKLMPLMDVCVISSHTEGLPITLLEAIRACVPIIATKVGGIPDVLEYGKYGKLVTPGDVSQLARAIADVHRETEKYKQNAVEARNYFVRRYSARKMADSYLDFYNTVVTSCC